MYTSTELKKDSQPYFNKRIEELEIILKLTKKTVKQNTIKKEIMFWETQLTENEDKGKSLEFFERYPTWGT